MIVVVFFHQSLCVAMQRKGMKKIARLGHGHTYWDARSLAIT